MELSKVEIENIERILSIWKKKEGYLIPEISPELVYKDIKVSPKDAFVRNDLFVGYRLGSTWSEKSALAIEITPYNTFVPKFKIYEDKPHHNLLAQKASKEFNKEVTEYLTEFRSDFYKKAINKNSEILKKYFDIYKPKNLVERLSKKFSKQTKQNLLEVAEILDQRKNNGYMPSKSYFLEARLK